MLRYAAARLVLTLPTLFVVAVLVFVVLRLIPGDPAILVVGENPRPEVLAQVRHEMGLDRPVAVQFAIWLRDVVGLRLGVSLITREPVLETMFSRLGVTAQVVLLATALATLLAVPAGMLAARSQDRPLDLVIVAASVLCLSVPSFWVGILLILVFGVHLAWLPTVGYVSVTEGLARGLPYLVMPVACLVLVQMGSILRMTRSTTLEALRSEYVTAARAKGLSEGVVLTRHVFRNAFAPTLTLLGMILGSLLGGAAVIETVFTLPGLGRLLVDSIYARDYPMVQGIVLLVAFTQVLVNLGVDLVYPVLDPRVRL